MIIDTHCHLDFQEFSSDLDEVLQRAKESGVAYMINVSSNIEGCISGAELARSKEQVFSTLGIHPHHADETTDAHLRKIEELYKNGQKIVAVGEVGLDYYKNFSSKNSQKKVFLYFLNFKKRTNLPIIIHSREAAHETIDIVRGELGSPVDGVLHCFSGDVSYLKRALDLGLHISFTCNITFKNASGLRDVARYVPQDRLLLETDAPFLAPQEFRGRRNEPAYITYLVDTISGILDLSKDFVENITTRNAKKLFRLDIKDQ